MTLRLGSLYRKGALALQRGKQTVPWFERSCKSYVPLPQALCPPSHVNQLAARRGKGRRGGPGSYLPRH